MVAAAVDVILQRSRSVRVSRDRCRPGRHALDRGHHASTEPIRTGLVQAGAIEPTDDDRYTALKRSRSVRDRCGPEP